MAWRHLTLARSTTVVLTLAMTGLIAAQLIPAERSNPPVVGDVTAPPEIKATLRRACYDCHSNETRWPWYGHVAPFSWLVASHVRSGRKELNFFEWSAYYPQTRRHKLQWMGRALRANEMPPWWYSLTHPASRLSERDRLELERWVATGIGFAPPQERAR